MFLLFRKEVIKTNYKILIPALGLGAFLIAGAARLALVRAEGSNSSPPIIEKLTDKMSQYSDGNDDDADELESVGQKPTQAMSEIEDGSDDDAE